MKKINLIALILLTALTAVLSHATAPDTVWTRTYNRSITAFHDAYGCAIDTSGNIYVVGSSQEMAGVNNDILILKYNSDGDTLWSWFYDSGNYDMANDCVINNMQQLYVAGSINNKAALLKFNQNGDTIWTRIINDPNYYGKTCALDDANNVYLAGNYDNGTNLIPFIKKYSPQGDSLWFKTISLETPTWDGFETNDCVLDSSNNIYLTGFTYFHGSFVTKCNTLGDTLWTRYNNIADTVNETGHECHVDKEGNVYVSGEYFTSPNDRPYMALKYDSAGDVIWCNMQANVNTNTLEGRKSALDKQGNLYVTGQSAMIKYNSQGDTVWTFWIGSGATGYDCALTPDGELVICGSLFDGGGLSNFLTIKYQIVTGVTGEKPQELSASDRITYSAYPNPFTSYASIKGLEGQVLYVYNVLGQRVQVCKGAKVGEKLPPGVYFAVKATLPSIKPVKLIKIK